MITPLITVIIPFYNRIDFTIRALRSAQQQSYKNIEILLINDGSSESISDLLTIIKEDSRSNLINSPNLGPASARNLGIKASKGVFIAFLDSDDYWSLDKLERQMAIMIKKNWKFSYTSYFIIKSNKTEAETKSHCRLSYIYPLPAFYCSIATPTVILKKELLTEINFNETMRAGEDTLLWLMLSKKTILHLINYPLTTVSIGEFTTAKNINLKLKAFNNINRYGFSKFNIIKYIHFLYIYLRNFMYSLSC